MAKKSFWRKLGDALFGAIAWLFRSIYSLLKWIATGVFNLLVRGAKWLYHLVSRSAGNAAHAHAVAARQPKNPAANAPLVELKAISGNLHDFERQLNSSKSLIGIILGSRGSGKSALGMRLLENVHAQTGRLVAALGFAPDSLPAWIECIDDLSQAKNGSFLLVDEGGIVFSARSAFSSPNKLLSELLLIARHKDLSVLFIAQNSANLDVNALRQADYLLLRKPSLLQHDFERKTIQKIYEDHAADFKTFASDPGVTLVYANNYLGFTTNRLPGFWSEHASKAFKNYSTAKK